MSRGDSDEPGFEAVFPDLDVAGRLLAAVARHDEAAIDRLRESTDADWWNVAWTLALLIHGIREGEPSAVALVDSLMSDDQQDSDQRS
jgi:hypothetical protein